MKLWRIALACWLILYGLLLVSNVRFDGENVLLGFGAIAAAVLLLFDK